MKLLSFNSFILLIVLTLSSFGCGETTTSESNQETSTDATNSEEMTASSSTVNTSSKASEYQKKPCELLTEEIIKKYVTIDKEIEKEFFEYDNRPSYCSYSWKKPNADEATKNQIKEVGEMVKTDGKHEMDMKKMTPVYSVAISIHDYAGSAQSFVPKQLTDEQIEEQVKRTKEIAMNRKETQNMSKDMQEKIISASTEKVRSELTKMRDKTVIVEGIGEAAYWNPSGFDNTFMILLGGKSINLEVYVSPNREENIEIAKKIAKEIL